MPGVGEINKVLMALQSYETNARSDSRKLSLKLLALHGNLPPNEQKKVFLPAHKGELKIVISTNVAEASVTIPDVSCFAYEVIVD